MPYRLSALAGQDLEEIWSYVAEDDSPRLPIDSLTR
jgi:plasmid stabilization system protein ParE